MTRALTLIYERLNIRCNGERYARGVTRFSLTLATTMYVVRAAQAHRAYLI